MKWKFFTGVFAGIIGTIASITVLLIVAMNNRVVRMSLFNLAQDVMMISDTKTDTTTGAAINWQSVSEKSRQIYGAIDRYYLNQIDNTKVQDGIYKGIVASLEDPYTNYFNKEEFKEFTASSDGTYCGIGVLVGNSTKGAVVVKTFKKGSSAENGILSGDIIYEVNNKKVKDVTEAVTLIKGKEGTFVDVTVLRNNKKIRFNLERRKLEVDTVASKLEKKDGKKIGYIVISEFDAITEKQFRDELNSLEKKGIDGLIIDLRNNPGGLLDVTCNMLDRLLPKGILVYTLDKNGKKVVERSDDKESFKKPVVILVNERSASASEVFSGAMKDHKAATLIGTKTFGKGIVQTIVPFADGTAMKVTVSKYYTPNGVNIHGTGITPDIIENDAKKQFKKGINVILDKIKHKP